MRRHMARRRSTQEEEPEVDETDGDDELDESEIEDQVEDETGSDISLNIGDDRVEVSIPRDGNAEATLKAVGTLLKGLD